MQTLVKVAAEKTVAQKLKRFGKKYFSLTTPEERKKVFGTSKIWGHRN